MTMYADTVKRLKSQWQAMLDAGKMPLFEIQDASGEYHVFDVDFFYNVVSKCWNLVALNDGGFTVGSIDIDQHLDDLSHYLELLYNRCFKECCI